MTRLALAETGVEYSNIFVPRDVSLEECRQMGGQLTTNIPLLSVDGVHYTQSLAILRKIGRDFGGGLLYPTGDNELLYRIDMLLDAAFDLRDRCYQSQGLTSEWKINAFASEVKPHMSNFERLIGNSVYMCGSRFTLADIGVYDAVANFAVRMLPSSLDGFPSLHRYVDRVAARPRIAGWLASPSSAQIPWYDALVPCAEVQPMRPQSAKGSTKLMKKPATTGSRQKPARKATAKNKQHNAAVPRAGRGKRAVARGARQNGKRRL